MSVNTLQTVPDIRPIGADGTYLTADISQSDGVRWGHIYPTGISSGFTILSMNGVAELLAGTGLVNPSFTATYNYTPSGANITAVGSGTQNINSPYTSFSFTGSFPNATVNASQVFTLIASGEGGRDTESVTVYWRQIAYWGVKPTGITVDEAFIKSFSNSGFRATHSGIMSLNSTSTGYIWYAFRTAAGTPIVRDGGSNINGGLQYVSTIVNFTNAAGFADSYDVYRSDYPNLGSRSYYFV